MVLVYNFHDASALFTSGDSCVGIGQKLLEVVHLVERRMVGFQSDKVGHRKTASHDEKQESASRLYILLLLLGGQTILK